jgi:D-alanyl-D-alanine dipeptidase/carboxypeptidase
LINKLYPLAAQEIGHSLSLVPTWSQRPEILLEMKTAAVLSHLMSQIRCQDHILPVSGYRSRKEQLHIYTESLAKNGRDFTEKYVALPNHSEHQTGLAIDLALKKDNIDFICPDFPYEGICETFREKAPLYGFIERYQKGKEAVTGIAHEPWHFRYVGYPHSVIMKQYGLSLEEYVEMIRLYPYEEEHFITDINGQKIEIFYQKATMDHTELSLPEDSIYQISGNNVDGFIITIWG